MIDRGNVALARKAGSVAGLVALAACLLTTGPAADEVELWRHRNLGKALFETPTTIAQAPAELKKALDLAPDSVRDRLNYGLALLRSGDVELAITELVAVQKRDPSLPHTWFNLGVAYKRQRMYDDAIRQFEHMAQLVPDEPVTHYNLGVLYKISGRAADALKQFETASSLAPRMVAPLYQIYTHYRLAGDEPAMDRTLKAYQEAKRAAEAADEGAEDMEWCFYAELYDPGQAHPPGRDTSAAPALKFEDRVLPGSAKGLTVLDADNDGKPDFLAWSATSAVLYRSARENVATVQAKDIHRVVPGDFDNDGLTDLCVLTQSGPVLYRNRGGRFEQATLDAPARSYSAAVWVDFDHDYDLDLFLFGERSVLMRNEGASGFHDRSAAFPFEPATALDAIAFRAAPDSNAVSIAVSYAGRPGVIYRDKLRAAYTPSPLPALPAGAGGLRATDFDNDSWMDLASDAGVLMNRNGRFVAGQVQARGVFATADLENRGLQDLIADGVVHRNHGLGDFAEAGQRAAPAAVLSWTEADFDSDGRIDLAYAARDGSIHVLYNRTVTKNRWAGVSVTGVKNVKSGLGAEIEIKAGNRYSKQEYRGIPLVFGLGAGAAPIDVIRINWPNGMIQNATNEAAQKWISIKEAPRMSGSCPMIFTWNGREIEFITDVLGVAPLGASAGDDGRVFPVDHDEYIQIPAESLVAKDGAYEVRVTEELKEVSYLDEISLMAVDHPANIEIFTNDKFKSPPFPEFRLFGVAKRLPPVSARDERGSDKLASILRRDRQYAGGNLTLNFGPGAAPDNKAVLFLNGWVDWADGSSFLAAAQGASPLTTPALQVKDRAGAWRTVIDDMGMPSGKPKTIAVDLSGRFLSASREVRIVTNLAVHWDEAFLSETAEEPETRITALEAATAQLRFRGFSRASIDPRREQPEAFDYDAVTVAAPWNPTPGLYTKYGAVADLLWSADDRMVIMGSGDELRLSYAASGLPPVPAGWRRDFLLHVDGWAKDADANTAYSQTVEPLPFHRMTGYPYGGSERFPSDSDHRKYLSDYIVRPATLTVQPLTQASSPRSRNVDKR